MQSEAIAISNEELVSMIQDGQEDLIEQLWNQVRPFVARAARGRRTITRTSSIDEEDLIQAGFLGLLEAIRTFRDGMECSFTSWLAYHLKTAFADALGVRSERQKHDPMHWALSLDVPVSAEDPEGAVLGDLVPCRNDPIADVDARIWFEQLAEELSFALEDLPADQQKALELRFYEDLTLAQAAEVEGVSVSELRRREGNGLRAIRNSHHRMNLEEFRKTWHEIDLQTPWYYHVGVKSFLNGHTSSTEALTIKRDTLFHKMTANGQDNL